jgi:hypothetical protein
MKHPEPKSAEQALAEGISKAAARHERYMVECAMRAAEQAAAERTAHAWRVAELARKQAERPISRKVETNVSVRHRRIR